MSADIDDATAIARTLIHRHRLLLLLLLTTQSASVDQPTAEDYEKGLSKHQLVMEFDMNTYKDLIEVYKITKSFIPSRTAQENTDTWTRR